MIPSQSPETFQHQAEMLANRVVKRFRYLHRRFDKQNITVFRLYDWDIPEIRCVVDWYAGHLVIGEYMRRQSVPGWLTIMGEAVARALGVPVDNLHLKARHAGKSDGMRYERLDHTNQKFQVSERDMIFWVNPWDFVDTGLFSDHRNTRQIVREMANGTDFLNLYCYTATFSCCAAKGGARSTLSVDRSETANDWARDNMSINGLSPASNTLKTAHTLEFLAEAAKQGLTFDLAVVDPPSYSTTRASRHEFDINRDHPGLLNAVLKVMRPGGTL
ncbi:MAG: class I SAM-dependent methyltransferase, partial [Desulfatirhabdiaceae bacterium]